MPESEKQLYAVIAEVRTCFNQLKGLAEKLHSEAGVNPSMRAVMETLSAKGALSVSEIARLKQVSRQHIQTIMNDLEQEKLVVPLNNPEHKRSPLFELSEKGRKTFAAILRREEKPLKRLASRMKRHPLEQARKVLAEMNRHLMEEINNGG